MVLDGSSWVWMPLGGSGGLLVALSGSGWFVEALGSSGWVWIDLYLVLLLIIYLPMWPFISEKIFWICIFSETGQPFPNPV